MESHQDQDVMGDEGLAAVALSHTEIQDQSVEDVIEPVQMIAIEPLNLYQKSVEAYQRHRKGIIKLGGLGIGSLGLGFATAAMASRAHQARA